MLKQIIIDKASDVCVETVSFITYSLLVAGHSLITRGSRGRGSWKISRYSYFREWGSNPILRNIFQVDIFLLEIIILKVLLVCRLLN